jgi:hypothetical protein
MSQLNERQRTFARILVLEGKSAEQAAISAGYSDKYARKSSHALVANPGVKAEIERLRERVEVHSLAQVTMSRDDVLNALSALSQALEVNPRDKIAALKAIADIQGYAAPRQSERVTLHAQLPAGLDGIDRETLRRIAYPALPRSRRVTINDATLPMVGDGTVDVTNGNGGGEGSEVGGQEGA